MSLIQEALRRQQQEQENASAPTPSGPPPLPAGDPPPPTHDEAEDNQPPEPPVPDAPPAEDAAPMEEAPARKPRVGLAVVLVVVLLLAAVGAAVFLATTLLSMFRDSAPAASADASAPSTPVLARAILPVPDAVPALPDAASVGKVSPSPEPGPASPARPADAAAPAFQPANPSATEPRPPAPAAREPEASLARAMTEPQTPTARKSSFEPSPAQPDATPTPVAAKPEGSLARAMTEPPPRSAPKPIPPPKPEPPPEPVVWPVLKLNAVVRNPRTGQSAAMLNHKLVDVGGEIEGVTLLEVMPDAVRLRCGHETRLLRMGQSL